MYFLGSISRKAKKRNSSAYLPQNLSAMKKIMNGRWEDFGRHRKKLGG
jgi:hypothetical protein